MNDDVKKLIDTAFQAISAIHVSGDDVEKMAAAKQALRRAFSLLKDEQKEVNHG